LLTFVIELENVIQAKEVTSKGLLWTVMKFYNCGKGKKRKPRSGKKLRNKEESGFIRGDD